jgi:alpha-tubulin suppressor-like RCC1 family protein
MRSVLAVTGCGAARRWVVPLALLLLIAGAGSVAASTPASGTLSAGASVISAGDNHSCAIESGKAFCWGDNSFGELGEGSTPQSGVPVPVDTSGVLAGKTLTQIATGDDFTCALDSAGAAYCWGGNYAGVLGDGSTVSYSSAPVAVDTSGVLSGKTLTQISANYGSTCALDTSGAAYCWGDNGYGELGDSSTANSSTPVAVDTSGVPGGAFSQLTDGGFHACALDAAGAAYCWGYNQSGQLGDDSIADSSVPVPVDTSGALAGKTLTQVNGGWDHTCALDSAGQAFCWGFNAYGQLGNGSQTDSSVPVPVNASGILAGKTLTQVSGNWGHTCAVDSNGAAYCWGDGAAGDLGDNDGESTVPVLAGPQAPTDVTASAGNSSATVSWTAPANLDTGTVTGYTAIASPSGALCTTTGATTCTITGLTNGTSYAVTVVAHTTVGDSGASAPASITPVGGGLAFTSASTDTVTYATAFSFTVTAVGSPTPKITKSGRLPSGVKFTAHGNGTATLSGTPRGTAAGMYPLMLTAKSKAGSATQAFTITVTRAPAIKKIPAKTARAGASVNLTIKATGYPAPALTESGQLPAGLTFTDQGNGTATITGTPTTDSVGTYTLAIRATNTIGSASQPLTLKIKAH